MNIIVNEVKTKYLLHMEDDWLFCILGDYIRPGLEILNQKNFNSYKELPVDRDLPNKKIGQVIFNKNYTELQENEVEGGFLCKTNENNINYIIHEHYNENEENELYQIAVKKYKRNCIYWPHFSLNPSIINTEIFKILGQFNKEGFFERNFADKYYKNGFVTCFFNRVSCRHIGKLLSQRNNPYIKNAYELNGINQFNSNNITHTNNVNNSEIISDDNYIFYKNKDSFDYDILFLENKTIHELKNIANSIPSCIGFNTWGYLKFKIRDEKDFIYLPNKINKPDGLYVKKIYANLPN